MSKAEEAALKVFPQKIEGDSRGSYDLNELNRQKFLLGYHQAEKDLELTCDDIKTIDKLLNQCVDYSDPYQEVLKRFKAIKDE